MAPRGDGGNVGPPELHALSVLERALLAEALRRHSFKVERYAKDNSLTLDDQADLRQWAKKLRRRADELQP